LKRIDQASFTLHVPQLRDHVAEHPGLHFHFTPDFVLGLRGRSRFEFIHESFVVHEGEMAILPEGIPHREVRAVPGEPFANLVVTVYNQTISVVLQSGGDDDAVRAERTEYFDTPKHDQLIAYLTEIAERHHDPQKGGRYAVKGLCLAYLETLHDLALRSRREPPVEKLKILQTKRLVREHLADSALGVRAIASQLHCSSDYLSTLFHRETGQRLIAYITQERVKAAVELLRGSPLTISEIAFAVGFESAGYFCRIFRKTLFRSPAEYRRSIDRTVVELESRPRAIRSEG